MAYRKNLEELWIHLLLGIIRVFILIVYDLLTINVLTLKGHCHTCIFDGQIPVQHRQLVLAGSICGGFPGSGASQVVS